MKALGIIVEYNPFHHGHALHIEKAKESCGADVVIAVMSGNFLQRGEPAIVSKWARTNMALRAGVDLVIELPYPFATQKADQFAKGAVTILSEIGCDYLCFGSESGNIQQFYDTYDCYHQSKTEINHQIKQLMKSGMNYPKAVATAFEIFAPKGKQLLDLAQPNNMLGFQYVTAAKQQKSQMEIFTIQRQHADYHDEHFSSQSIASATSIRKAIFSEQQLVTTIKQYVPPTTYNELLLYKQTYGQFHQWEHYWPFLQYQLLQHNRQELFNIYEMEEGLENRFLSFAEKANSFQQLIEQIKTKRYTWTRLQRAAVHLLTRTTKAEMEMHSEKVHYLRLLGFNSNGRAYLNQTKHHLSIPLIAKLSAFPVENIILDVRAAKIYSLALSTRSRAKQLKEEYSRPPILYHEID